MFNAADNNYGSVFETISFIKLAGYDEKGRNWAGSEDDRRPSSIHINIEQLNNFL